MAYTYTWTDAEQTSLRREDADGNVAFVPAAAGNRDYAEFVAQLLLLLLMLNLLMLHQTLHH